MASKIKFETKSELRVSLIGFLKMRNHWFTESKNYRGKVKVKLLLNSLDHIRDWNYWRHCLEVKNNQDVLRSLIPPTLEDMKKNMELLIAHCNAIAGILPGIYAEDHDREGHVRKDRIKYLNQTIYINQNYGRD